MGNKHSEQPTCTVKTRTRLFRAEDVVWMVLDKKACDSDWLALRIDADGFRLDMSQGTGKRGKPRVQSIGANWESVANELGFEKCEYVLNPDGTKCVLLYDEVPLSDDRESPQGN